MAYLVLARKYRSTTFDEVVGQEPIAQTLKSAIEQGRIAHAYLFTGTRGVGKTTMARILAKALNCVSVDAPTQTPCNTCEACKAISRGEDMDVLEIDGASNRGIDEIRELRANAIFRPSRCRYRIYYIDEVHMLTKEAFNALLKTLEEPPEHVKFIFATTEAEKVPATILSRCQRYDFRNIPTHLICDHLKSICKAEKVTAADDALFRISRAAAGSMRDGLSLLDQLLAGGDSVKDDDVVRILGTASDERILALVTAITDGNTAVALGELNAILQSGVTLASAVTGLCETFRNMMLVLTCGAGSELVELPESQKQAVAEVAKRFSVPSLVYAVGVLQAAGRNIRGSSLGRALAEAAIVRLAEADKFVDASSLVERLEALGSGAPVQKKKFSVAASPLPPAAAERSEAADPTPKPVIVWEAAWLKAHWQVIVNAVYQRKQTQLAGALGPAKVDAFDGKTLKLFYNGDHEIIRRRCESQLAGPIATALTELAGKDIHCEFVPAGGEAQANGNVGSTVGTFSTAEREEIGKDPAVSAVATLFDGKLVGLRRDTAPANNGPAADSGDEET